MFVANTPDNAGSGSDSSSESSFGDNPELLFSLLGVMIVLFGGAIFLRLNSLGMLKGCCTLNEDDKGFSEEETPSCRWFPWGGPQS